VRKRYTVYYQQKSHDNIGTITDFASFYVTSPAFVLCHIAVGYSGIDTITALMLEFERRNMYDDFVKIRDSFEELLLQYNYLIPQIVTRYRRSASL
jgi:hypothetical protein